MVLNWLKKVIPRRNKSQLPIKLTDFKKASNWRLSDSSKIKVCDTDNQIVYTDKNQKNYIVYTDSLITCIGILVYNPNRGIAGLCHCTSHDTYEKGSGKLTDNKLIYKMIKQMEREYGKIPLEVEIVIGDQPGKDLFKKSVETLLKFEQIKQKNVEVVYGGPAKAPDFAKNSITDTPARVA